MSVVNFARRAEIEKETTERTKKRTIRGKTIVFTRIFKIRFTMTPPTFELYIEREVMSRKEDDDETQI